MNVGPSGTELISHCHLLRTMLNNFLTFEKTIKFNSWSKVTKEIKSLMVMKVATLRDSPYRYKKSRINGITKKVGKDNASNKKCN